MLSSRVSIKWKRSGSGPKGRVPARIAARSLELVEGPWWKGKNSNWLI